MTAGNQLKAVITGDISDLKAKLSQADALLDNYRAQIRKLNSDISKQTNETKQAEQQLERLNNSFKKGSISVSQYENQQEKLNASIRDSKTRTSILKGELRKLHRETIDAERGMENLTASTTDYAQASQRTGQAVKNLGKTTKVNAVPAMQSFSQVVQDAPYGINGVANNIQQLTAQFGYLSNRTGGAKSAFKAMLASLTGPAGILLAVSAVTTVLVQYGDEILDAINKTDEFAKALTKAKGSVQGELATMRALLSVARDETVERQKRIDAIKILNKNYPELNNQIKLETINTKATTLAIDEATKAIERRAKMRAAEGLIATEAEKLFQKQVELEDEREKRIQESLNARVQSYKKYSRGIGTAALDLEKTRTEIEERINKEYGERLSDSEQKYRKYVQRLGGIIKNAPNLLALFGEEGDSLTDEIQKQVDKEGPVRVKIKPVSTITPRGAIEPETAEIAPISTEIKVEDNTDWESIYENMERAQEVAKIFSDATTASFAAMAGGIAKSLQTGNSVVDAFISSLIQSLGKMVAELAASAIETMAINQAKSTSGAITAASQTAASIPFGAFALPALIAGAVAAISGAFSNIGGFAQGGIVGGGSFNGDKIPAFVNSGEMILNMGQQRELFNLLDGRMGSLQGNAQSLKIQVEGVTRGENIYWSQQRYMNNRSRRG